MLSTCAWMMYTCMHSSTLVVATTVQILLCELQCSPMLISSRIIIVVIKIMVGVFRPAIVLMTILDGISRVAIGLALAGNGRCIF